MERIRVMLVDDSPLFIFAMQSAIEKDPLLQVVGTAQDGQQALTMVANLRPNVIVCDVQMPRMNGIEFLQALLPRYPVPVVVISSTPVTAFSALQAGAVDYIKKPEDIHAKEKFFNRLLSTIKMAANANMSATLNAQRQMSLVQTQPKTGVLLRAPKDAVIAIGASTGGTEAIAEIVRKLPANCPGVVITQHMPAGFTAMYASRLDKESKMHVSEATDGQRVEAGKIIIAAGDYHLRLQKDALGYYISSQKGPKVSGHTPSVDVLFESVAQTAGNRAVGTILTGMGADGAKGLLEMRKAGAYTIGQDEQSCVVYGMPMVAFNSGAVAKQLPLNQIANEIVRYVNGMI